MAIDEKRRQKLLAKKATKRKARQPPKNSLMRINFTAKTAAQFPIHECLMSINIFNNGIGTILLARKLPNNDLAFAAILIDSYCLGIKDALFSVASITEYLKTKNNIEDNEVLESIHPTCLRKMVEGAVSMI